MLPCAAVNAFKPHLAGLADYPYAKSDAQVKLDQNESPEDFPADLKARALERIARVAPFDFLDPWPMPLRPPPGTH